MTWERDQPKKSVACNGELIQHRRKGLNWTQKQLSEESGYCVRVISKLESGARVLPAVIEAVAGALSTESQKVYPEDLTADPLKLSRRYIDAFHVKQRDMVEEIADFTDANAIFQTSGDPSRFPFAGISFGLTAHHDSLQQLFSLLEVPSENYEACYEYYSRGSQVVVWGAPWIHHVGRPMNEPMPATLRFRFQRGMLVGLEHRLEANVFL